MCAIAGFFGAATPRDVASVLTDILAAMRHRGPDDSGAFIDGGAGVALGHNRLSILDLSAAGHQPMIDPNTGDALVFNGEIYNFRELRDALAVEGCVFHSQSDSEVLLRAFVQWGPACLERLKGMFAFAIWRAREKALYVVRDPIGVKPLYYRIVGDGVVFASEIKAFRALPNFPLAVDRRAIGQYLEFGYTFEAGRTIFQNVSKLGPGEMIICRAGEAPQISAYGVPHMATKAVANHSELVETLHATLDEVVGQQLVADVPVGILLSGGLDSSVIAALAARRAASVHTLTMAFGGSAIDERAEARRVADHIGAQNEEILIGADELSTEVTGVAATFDDIFSDWGTVTTRMLYRKARERGVKVVLTGEGADEIFGGYNLFRHAASRAPTDIWLFQLYRFYAGRRYGGYFGSFRRIMRGYLRESDGSRFDAMRLFESRNQLPNNYVMKVDKASMSVGVEARVPYLDQRVVDLAFRIPERYLLTQTSEKQILRDVAEAYGLLPPQNATRPKFGASVAASWMEEQPGFRDYARDIILAGGGWTQALGLTEAMQEYFLKNRTGYPLPHAISIFRNVAWRLLLLELWSKSLDVRANAG